jgi:hypothetical protein
MNAKEELLKELERADKSLEDVIAYNIHIDTITYWEDDVPDRITTSIKGTKLTEEELSKIDMEYDPGYGGQELFGTILFKDNSWFQRGEYDGSEWWVLMYSPTVEDVLGRKITYED